MTDEEILSWVQAQLVAWQKQYNIYSVDGATDKTKSYALGRSEMLIDLIKIIQETKEGRR